VDKHINPAGWKAWSTSSPQTSNVVFGEFNNTGPGSWQSGSTRPAYATNMSLDQVAPYSLSNWVGDTSFIDQKAWNYPAPFDTNTTSTPDTTGPSAGNVTVSGSSAYNGTVPPAGSLIVSQKPLDGKTVYPTIQEALNAAPASSNTNLTIFIYPGTYSEQLIVSKPGTTTFIGYSDSTDDYNQNQVKIQQSHGIDTQGDGSNVDGATVYVTGNYFYAYNINFENRNGTAQNIASLGFAVKSSKFAFLHGCQVYGNQDTLYISGSFFAFKTLIVGNVDFICKIALSYAFINR
jgi:hypothetical protein